MEKKHNYIVVSTQSKILLYKNDRFINTRLNQTREDKATLLNQMALIFMSPN